MVADKTKRAHADGGRLTREAIVDAAIDVADADGIGGLSMRRIADELGVGAMSLYRHIDDKDALIEAMAEEIGRRYPYPVDEDWPWRRRVATAVDLDWRLYQDHSWVVLVYATPRYSYGVDALEGLDWLAAGFSQLGVDVTRATEMALAVWNLVNGIALVAASDRLLSDGSSDQKPGGLADLIAGRVSVGLPFLSGLASAGSSAGRANAEDAARLVDPRASLDAGIGYLCAGFEASAR